MNMSLENLTEEEIELIKKHRKSKLELNIRHTIKQEGDFEEYKKMHLVISDDVIKLSTKNQTERNGKHMSSNGFFNDCLTKSDARKIRDFLNLFLEDTKESY